eukprot:3920_1
MNVLSVLNWKRRINDGTDACKQRQKLMMTASESLIPSESSNHFHIRSGTNEEEIKVQQLTTSNGGTTAPKKCQKGGKDKSKSGSEAARRSNSTSGTNDS